MSMMTSTGGAVEELAHTAYEVRQYREVGRAGLTARAEKLAPGGRFRCVDGVWQPQSYVGHAVVAMVANDPANAALEAKLRETQAALHGAVAADDLLYALPTASWHQTVANTLSAERYERQVVDAGRAGDYPHEVGRVLGELSGLAERETVRMRMIGLAFFGSALGVLGAFDEPAEFHRVLVWRERFYGRPEIAAWDIRRTRPFIGHVTLAYLGRMPTAAERAGLLAAAEAINTTLWREPVEFAMPYAELRSYWHLAEFTGLPELPRSRL